jgi:hypothetical protein
MKIVYESGLAPNYVDFVSHVWFEICKSDEFASGLLGLDLSMEDRVKQKLLPPIPKCDQPDTESIELFIYVYEILKKWKLKQDAIEKGRFRRFVKDNNRMTQSELIKKYMRQMIGSNLRADHPNYKTVYSLLRKRIQRSPK